MARPAAVRWQGEAVYTCEGTEKELRVLENPAGRSMCKAGRRPKERERDRRYMCAQQRAIGGVLSCEKNRISTYVPE